MNKLLLLFVAATLGSCSTMESAVGAVDGAVRSVPLVGDVYGVGSDVVGSVYDTGKDVVDGAVDMVMPDGEESDS
jgi:hypothetical protein